MTNVASKTGFIPFSKHISQMEWNEVGYTFPWAYNPETDTLDETHYIIRRRTEQATLEIKCLKPGLYSLRFWR